MKGMGPGITVWGGIPSVLLLESATTDQAFDEFLGDLFKILEVENQFILGVSDNVPPDANLCRIEEITKRVESFPLRKQQK